jgi:hypothetical protein
MRGSSVIYSSPDLARLDPIESVFCVTLASGVPTICAGQIGYPVFMGKDEGTFTQAAVDAFLGSVNEFAVTTAFGSTAMGTDTFGFVLNLQGQAKSALYVDGSLSLVVTDPGAMAVGPGKGTVTTVLADTLVTTCAVTTLGNIYGRVTIEGYDGAGGISAIIRVGWLPK